MKLFLLFERLRQEQAAKSLSKPKRKKKILPARNPAGESHLEDGSAGFDASMPMPALVSLCLLIPA